MDLTGYTHFESLLDGDKQQSTIMRDRATGLKHIPLIVC